METYVGQQVMILYLIVYGIFLGEMLLTFMGCLNFLPWISCFLSLAVPDHVSLFHGVGSHFGKSFFFVASDAHEVAPVINRADYN